MVLLQGNNTPGEEMHTNFLKGSWVALITPFSEDGKIDFNAFEKLVSMQIAAGTDGILICGTTGESVTLTFDEKGSDVRNKEVNRRKSAFDVRHRW